MRTICHLKLSAYDDQTLHFVFVFFVDVMTFSSLEMELSYYNYKNIVLAECNHLTYQFVVKYNRITVRRTSGL